MKKILLLILIAFLLIPIDCFATVNEVNIYFFHSATCDICKQEKTYLQALKDRYPNIRVYEYETSDNEDNYKLMREIKNLYGESRTGVPFTVIADTPYHGFSEAVKCKMQKVIYAASYNAYENKTGQKLGISYRRDLEGDVEEYKEQSTYSIEEKGTEGKHPKPKQYNSRYEKYKASIILISLGLLLALICLIIKIKERRER